MVAMISEASVAATTATDCENISITRSSKVAAGALWQYGRWAMVACLTALTMFLLVADDMTFSGKVGTLLRSVLGNGYRAELTVFVSLFVLYLTKQATPHARQQGKGGSKVDLVDGAKKMNRTPVVKNRGGPGFAPCGTASASSVTSTTSTSTPPQSSAVSKWNQAIDAAARQGDMQMAEQVFLELESSGVQPDSVSYNLVIRACAKRGNVAAAERWITRMEASRVRATVCSYNTLLDACAKADKAEACERWLQHMLDRGIEANVISYATAIHARARRGDIAAAEAWLAKMISAGVQPDAVSYNSIIHACSVKGAALAAERWLREMHARGLEMTVATYTAVIDACAKCGDFERAEAWFARLEENRVDPNVITYSALIDACAKAGNLPRAEYWHGKMLERGITPNAHSYTALINACAKRAGPGGAEAAEQWLDRSEETGVVNDVVVYSSVIDACGKSGDAERALRVFRRMQARGLKPHVVAYAALARPYAYRGDWIKVESIAQGMESEGVVTNEYFTYAQLLSYAVARPRQAQRAEAYFRKALQTGINANDHVVGVLARAVGRPHCTELMAELCGGRQVPQPPPRRGQEGSRGAGGNSGAAKRPGMRPA